MSLLPILLVCKHNNKCLWVSGIKVTQWTKLQYGLIVDFHLSITPLCELMEMEPRFLAWYISLLTVKWAEGMQCPWVSYNCPVLQDTILKPFLIYHSAGSLCSSVSIPFCPSSLWHLPDLLEKYQKAGKEQQQLLLEPASFLATQKWVLTCSRIFNRRKTYLDPFQDQILGSLY